MSLMEISKSVTQNLDYSERNQILLKNDTQKSGSSQKNYTQKSGNSPKRYPKIREQPQKSTQNNGTSPYRDICKLPPPPESSITREWNGGEAIKSPFCSVLDITLFLYFSFPHVLLFYLHYFIIFPSFLNVFCSVRTDAPAWTRSQYLWFKSPRSNRYTSQSTMPVEKSTS